MWAIALNNTKTFDLLMQSLKRTVSYEVVTTSTGTKVAKAPIVDQAADQRPHFFLIDRDAEQTKHAISWVYKNLHPQALISSDLTDDWRQAFGEPQDEALFLPSSCLRSAGRIDMGGGPILFEEILFDRWVQIALAKQLLPKNRELNPQHKIFGSDRPIVKPAEQHWLSEQVRCQSYDTSSGELLLAGKRLSLKIGCLKVFSGPAESMELVLDTLVRIRVPV